MNYTGVLKYVLLYTEILIVGVVALSPIMVFFVLWETLFYEWAEHWKLFVIMFSIVSLQLLLLWCFLRTEGKF